MPFDDLTNGQRELIIKLVEKLRSGSYAEELRASVNHDRPWTITLMGTDGLQQEEVQEFTEPDLHALDREGYITLLPKSRGAYMFSLAGKAYQEHRTLRPEVIDRPGRQPDPAKVFVVHGRNSDARRAMFDFLRALGLQPIEWIEAVSLTETGSPFIGQILDRVFDIAQAVVVLITGDDIARLREHYVNPGDPPHERALTPQARPNVLFEAGLAFGRNPQRTILVELGETRPFSDIAGRHVIRINNTVTKRQELAARLRGAGCSVDIVTRTDWHETGDFDSSILPLDDSAQRQHSEDEPPPTVATATPLMEIIRPGSYFGRSGGENGQFSLILKVKFRNESERPTLVNSLKLQFGGAWHEPDQRPPSRLSLFNGHGSIVDSLRREDNVLETPRIPAMEVVERFAFFSLPEPTEKWPKSLDFMARTTFASGGERCVTFTLTDRG